MENQTKKKRNKPLIIALIGAGALAAGIGGVFATNSITINGGGTIEFGQGVTSTSTCDAAITTSIDQTYDAATDKFNATTITISGIKDFSCDGKTIHVSLVDTSNNVGYCSVDGTSANGAAFLIADGGTTGTDDDITETVTISGTCDASLVAKVAITTS